MAAGEVNALADAVRQQTIFTKIESGLTFRFDRRRSNSRGLLFCRLIAVSTAPHAFDQLIA